jgi:anti-sigma factor RsiW
MGIKHLSDGQLQAYAENSSPANASDIERHLQICRTCQAQLAAYRRIAQQLQNETGFALPENFAASVVSRVMPERTSVAERLMLALAVVGCAAMTIFFSGREMMSLMQNLWQSSFAWLAMPLGGMMGKLGLLAHGSTSLLIFAAAILVIVGLVDKFILQPRLK